MLAFLEDVHWAVELAEVGLGGPSTNFYGLPKQVTSQRALKAQFWPICIRYGPNEPGETGPKEKP